MYYQTYSRITNLPSGHMIPTLYIKKVPKS
jgi:hypothetical protein